MSKKFSEKTPAEQHATWMRNLWDAELMFLEYPDGSSEDWERDDRDAMLREHKKQMAAEGLESSAI